MADIKDPTERQRAAADEYMAALSEKGIDRSLKDRIISFVKNALRSIGINIDFSDRDIIDFLARSKQNLMREQKQKETANRERTQMAVGNGKILKDVNGNVIDRRKRISSHDEAVSTIHAVHEEANKEIDTKQTFPFSDESDLDFLAKAGVAQIYIDQIKKVMADEHTIAFYSEALDEVMVFPKNIAKLGVSAQEVKAAIYHENVHRALCKNYSDKEVAQIADMVRRLFPNIQNYVKKYYGKEPDRIKDEEVICKLIQEEIENENDDLINHETSFKTPELTKHVDRIIDFLKDRNYGRKEKEKRSWSEAGRNTEDGNRQQPSGTRQEDTTRRVGGNQEVQGSIPQGNGGKGKEQFSEIDSDPHSPSEEEAPIHFRVEDDPEILNRLNHEKTIKTYRAMVMIDGKMYPPMSSKLNGQLRNPSEIGVWERSDENPENAFQDKNGKWYFNLKKDNNKERTSCRRTPTGTSSSTRVAQRQGRLAQYTQATCSLCLLPIHQEKS